MKVKDKTVSPYFGPAHWDRMCAARGYPKKIKGEPERTIKWTVLENGDIEIEDFDNA